MNDSNDIDDLLDNIRSAFGRALLPTLNSSSARWFLYEIYIFWLIIEEAVRAGADAPVFERSDGSSANSLCFRTRPSRLNRTDPYTHAVLTFSRIRPYEKKTLEVHIGIYISGESYQRTESDICVLFAEEAAFFRTTAARVRSGSAIRRWPDSTKVLLTAECKFLMRNLGAAPTNEAIGRYKGLSARNYAIVTNTPSKASGHRVTACFNTDAWHPSVVPASPRNVADFRSMLNRVFRTYIETLKDVLS